MTSIVECVPNFSEGRDLRVINAIADSVGGVGDVKLLSVEPDRDYNRTVVTFVGGPDGVIEAAFRATARAAELIDMALHSGEHPRIGATDVVPFVPVSGVTMAECAGLASGLGERLAAELGVPVYLYGHAARAEHRRTLQQIGNADARRAFAQADGVIHVCKRVEAQLELRHRRSRPQLSVGLFQ